MTAPDADETLVDDDFIHPLQEVTASRISCRSPNPGLIKTASSGFAAIDTGLLEMRFRRLFGLFLHRTGCAASFRSLVLNAVGRRPEHDVEPLGYAQAQRAGVLGPVSLPPAHACLRPPDRGSRVAFDGRLAEQRFGDLGVGLDQAQGQFRR